MAHFLARIPESMRKTIVSAQGNKVTGIVTQAASWSGCIETRICHREGCDHFQVWMIPWSKVGKSENQQGDTALICTGVMGDKGSIVFPELRTTI